MKKREARKASARKIGERRSVKPLSAKRARLTGTKPSVTLDTAGKFTFNHAIIYVKDATLQQACTVTSNGMPGPRLILESAKQN